MTEPVTAQLSPAEHAVRDALGDGRVQVVVFWAAWCGNSISQIERGLAEAIERHPEVAFTFVSLWDAGATGEATLREHGIPERVTVLAQPGVGQDAPKETRQRVFLHLPVTWIPTTWVFRPTGELATAFNYGEVEMTQLDEAIAGALSSW